jgi:signal transduction histidine kinase
VPILQRIFIFFYILGLTLCIQSSLAAEGPSSTRLSTGVSSWSHANDENPSDFLTKTPEERGKLSFGYTHSPIWLRFELHNDEDQASSKILTIDPPLLDQVDLTEFSSKSDLLFSSQFRITDSENRPMPRRRATFQIPLPAQQTVVVVLRISSAHNINLQLQVSSPEQEELMFNHEQMILGMYYGLFFSVFLANLLLFFGTREKIYVEYIAFIFCLGLMLSCLNGVLNFNFGSYFNFSRYLCAMSAVTLSTAHIFTRKFLQTPINAPRIDKLHIVAIYFGLMIAVWNLSPFFPHFSVFLGHAIDSAIGASVIIIFCSVCSALKTGSKPAVFFLIAWGALLVMTSLYFLANYGVIHGSIFTQYAVQVGSSIEMVFFSIALAYRVYKLKEAKVIAEEKALETEKLRSLIHIICHDLRNPLTVISGYAQLHLKRGRTEWEPIEKAANNQKDILDYVSIKEALETGKQKLNLVPIRITDIIESAKFIFEERLKLKNIQLLTDLERDCSVIGDFTLLTHTVVANLISNAIKFTHPGGIIKISACSAADRVYLSVSDSGIGIPRSMIDDLFSNNIPTTRPGTQGEIGSGFGMPLVKTVVVSFGGWISVKSLTQEEASVNEASGTSIVLNLRKAQEV